jgi:undecaprenyl pyrophosphate phosphatase UppP
LEIAIAALAGILGIVTIFWHDWIEALTGWDPDHHNGSFEWLIVVILLAVAIAVGVAARRDWRRFRLQTS